MRVISEFMSDHFRVSAADGWKAETSRVIETDKKGKIKDKGWACDLIPKPLIIARYFAKEQAGAEDPAGTRNPVTDKPAFVGHYWFRGKIMSNG